jgi:hypothetical protein
LTVPIWLCLKVKAVTKGSVFLSPHLRSPLLQLSFGLEPMFLVVALFLSPQHPNFVGLQPDCLARGDRALRL